MPKLHQAKLLRGMIAALCCLATAVPALAASPTTTATTAPRLSASSKEFEPKAGDFASAIVLDARTKKVLYSFKPDIPWTAASLTKLVGAMTFLDGKPTMSTIVSLKKEDEVGGGRLRVKSGATLSVRDMLYSSIVGSANNAATALARLSGLGYKGFVKAMNAKVKSLGCSNTVFKDPSGMDPGNMTTASDMAKIAAAAFSKAEIRSPASTSYYTFRIRNTNEKKTITNTNKLLLDEDNGLYVLGGKTGYLDESRNNLTLRVRSSRTDISRELIIVVFGADSKEKLFDAASRLAQWSWTAYDWPTPALASGYGR